MSENRTWRLRCARFDDVRAAERNLHLHAVLVSNVADSGPRLAAAMGKCACGSSVVASDITIVSRYVRRSPS